MTTPLLPTLTPTHSGSMPAVNRVHHTSAIDLLKAMPSGSVDAIVTDPPYGVDKASWDTHFPTDWIEEAWRVTSRIIVMVGTGEIVNVANVVGRYKSCIALHARNGMTRSNISFGNWIPALVCGDWDWKPRPNYLPFNVSITENIPHPSPKPMQAMMKLLQHYTTEGDLILDPFGGSGSTLIAAQKLGRNFIGCDISAEYCELMRHRLAMPYTMPLFAANATA